MSGLPCANHYAHYNKTVEHSQYVTKTIWVLLAFGQLSDSKHVSFPPQSGVGSRHLCCCQFQVQLLRPAFERGELEGIVGVGPACRYLSS